MESTKNLWYFNLMCHFFNSLYGLKSVTKWFFWYFRHKVPSTPPFREHVKTNALYPSFYTNLPDFCSPLTFVYYRSIWYITHCFSYFQSKLRIQLPFFTMARSPSSSPAVTNVWWGFNSGFSIFCWNRAVREGRGHPLWCLNNLGVIFLYLFSTSTIFVSWTQSVTQVTQVQVQ